MMIFDDLWEIHYEWEMHRWEMTGGEFMEATCGPSPPQISGKLTPENGLKVEI